MCPENHQMKHLLLSFLFLIPATAKAQIDERPADQQANDAACQLYSYLRNEVWGNMVNDNSLWLIVAPWCGGTAFDNGNTADFWQHFLNDAEGIISRDEVK